MEVKWIKIKIEQRLNKLSTSTYDNLECWHIIEAFNKAQLEWVREQLNGLNITKESAESTNKKVTDLEKILKPKRLKVFKKQNYYETEEIPSDFLEFNRLTPKGKHGGCERDLTSWFIEESNVNIYLNDEYMKPSFEWGETIHTMSENTFKVYTNNTFTIEHVDLLYYRKPKEIFLEGCENFEGKDLGDIDPEFKDDIVEILIDKAAAILAGDMEIWNQYQRNEQNSIKKS
jgi:hypothetical protein